VTRGGAFFDETCTPGVVLVAGLEEFIGDLARRLRHFHADPQRLYIVDKLPQEFDARVERLRAHVAAVKPVLVIIDTLIALGRSIIKDLNAAAQVEPVVQSVTDIAHDFGAAVILAHHAQKNGDSYRDSTAIGGAVDVIATMQVPEGKADPTLRKVSVVGRVPTRHFAFRYDGRHYLLDPLADLDAMPHQQPGADLSLDDRIVAAVRSRPGCSTNTVADVVKANRSETFKRIDAMLASGLLRDESEGSRARKLYVPNSYVQRAAL
jgi:hypothetical protein